VKAQQLFKKATNAIGFAGKLQSATNPGKKIKSSEEPVIKKAKEAASA